MSQQVTITAAAITLDPIQQKFKIDLTYNQTVPNTDASTNDLPCALQVSESGDPFTFKNVIESQNVNCKHGSAQISSCYGILRAGQNVYLRLVSTEPGLGGPAGTGNVVSNVFHASNAPSA